MPIIGRKPEVSLGLGLATGAVVYGTYQHFVPNQADIRVGKPGDETLEKARKQAAWFSAAIVGGISLIAKDPTIFIIGGSMVVALDWATRSNNWTNPLSGRIELNPFTVEREGMQTREVESAASGYEGLQAVN
jgi:hypothetical protein